jgi:hypothetical protein
MRPDAVVRPTALQGAEIALSAVGLVKPMIVTTSMTQLLTLVCKSSYRVR